MIREELGTESYRKPMRPKVARKVFSRGKRGRSGETLRGRGGGGGGGGGGFVCERECGGRFDPSKSLPGRTTKEAKISGFCQGI